MLTTIVDTGQLHATQTHLIEYVLLQLDEYGIVTIDTKLVRVVVPSVIEYEFAHSTSFQLKVKSQHVYQLAVIPVAPSNQQLSSSNTFRYDALQPSTSIQYNQSSGISQSLVL